MPTFAGIGHLALSVRDVDLSASFYSRVLDFLVVLDFGYGRLCLHKASRFTLALLQHPGGSAAAFSELNPGLDHLGLVAADRDELLRWEERFRAEGVIFTPIRDMPLGHHLNFRDPDDIPWEFFVPAGEYAVALRELATRDVPDEEVLERARQMVTP